MTSSIAHIRIILCSSITRDDQLVTALDSLAASQVTTEKAMRKKDDSLKMKVDRRKAKTASKKKGGNDG